MRVGYGTEYVTTSLLTYLSRNKPLLLCFGSADTWTFAPSSDTDNTFTHFTDECQPRKLPENCLSVPPPLKPKYTAVAVHLAAIFTLPISVSKAALYRSLNSSSPLSPECTDLLYLPCIRGPACGTRTLPHGVVKSSRLSTFTLACTSGPASWITVMGGISLPSATEKFPPTRMALYSPSGR